MAECAARGSKLRSEEQQSLKSPGKNRRGKRQERSTGPCATVPSLVGSLKRKRLVVPPTCQFITLRETGSIHWTLSLSRLVGSCSDEQPGQLEPFTAGDGAVVNHCARKTPASLWWSGICLPDSCPAHGIQSNATVLHEKD